MATSYVRCYKCRGLKQVAAIGGIVKDCWICDATGKVEIEEAPILEVIQSKMTPEDAPVLVPLDVVLADAQLRQVTADLEVKLDSGVSSEAQPTVIQNETVVDTPPNYAVQLGVSEELLGAVLDEPRMKPDEWRMKYKGVAGLLGPNGTDEIMTKVERASLRERYALMQPIAPRKVNLGASQDAAVNTDVEYLKFKAQEDAKIKAELEKKKAVKK